MARPKKIVIEPETVETAMQEAITEVKNEDRRTVLQARIDYLRGLKEELVTEGANDIGTLDVIIGKVIQEQGKL